MDISSLIAKQRQTNSPNKGEFTPATGWLNVGANVEDTFVSIGGIAIENIKPLKGSSDFSKIQRSLVAAILEKFNSLKEGEATNINLQVELRKIGNSEVSEDSLDIDWKL